MNKLLFLLLSVIAICAHAREISDHDYFPYYWSERVEINGICYRFIDEFDEPFALVTDFSTPEETIEKYSGVVYIPASVKYEDVEYSVEIIYHNAFQDCTNLNDVILEEGIHTIQHSAFANCGEIKINFPASLKYVHFNAFYNTVITNSPGFAHLVEIGGALCAAMPEMTSVTISQRTLRLLNSFLENSNVEEIVFEDAEFNLENILHLQEYVFTNTKLKEVRLPVRPMMLYIRTFCNDENIGRIVFSDPEGRTMKTSCADWFNFTDYKLIEKCPNLNEIVCMSQTPPEFANDSWADFKPISYVHIMDDYSHTVLKVPARSEKLYADHPVWGRFEHIADMDGNFYKTTKLEITNAESVKTTRFVTDGNLPIRVTVETPSIVTVYNTNGAEVCREHIDAGEFYRTLQPGVYIVRTSAE